MAAIWITPAGSLGIIPELEYYNLNLQTYSPGSTVTYTLVSGTLPSGLSLASNGNISGTTEQVNLTVTSNFTVRATDTVSEVSDRTFNLTVAQIETPNIQPESGHIGNVIAGDYFTQLFTLANSTPFGNVTWTVDSGSIPNVTVLNSSTGNLSGYIEPVSGNTTFSFDILADDGAKSDLNSYTLLVYDRATMTADTTLYTADNVSIITADTGLYSPYLITPAGSIANVRQNTNFNYRILAEDYNNANLTYSLVSGSLPIGLTLYANTGWISGTTVAGNLESNTSTFSIKAFKTDYPEYETETREYTIKVLGQSALEIEWVTEGNLGTIYNGAISELYVIANLTPSGSLTYTLTGNGLGGLPPGLSLLPDGVIAGRPSFDTNANIDTYTFTINATDSSGFVSSSKQFSVQVLERNSRPYENLYVQVLPDRAGRTIYNDLINNTDVFPPSYIYRYWDEWFSKNTLRRMLFLTGLNPDTDSQYINAMTLNHYWKTLRFGTVKTAVAKDDNLNTVYEVVYIDIIDQQVNASGFGPNIAETVPTNSQNISTVYPNSFPNMVQRLADNVGYQDRGILPRWMTSRQPDGTVLGFTRALVLCYTNPGRSAEVAYRVRNAYQDFNLIDFTIDRYEWDSILSNNYIKSDEAITGTGNITANNQSNIVTGDSTTFTSELAPNAIIYVSNTAIGNIVSITDNTTLILDSNSAGNIANLSFTYSNIFQINNYVAATGNVTANTSSNIVTGIAANITGTGTITGNTESTTITGTGTTFTTEATVGKNIYVSGNSIGTIRSILSANTLTVLNPLSSNISGSAFEIEGVSTLFTTELHIGDAVVVNTNVVLGYVSSITSDTNLTMTANSTANCTDISYTHTFRDPYTTPSDGDKYLKYPQVGVIS
jgi:hypothetical protein